MQLTLMNDRWVCCRLKVVNSSGFLYSTDPGYEQIKWGWSPSATDILLLSLYSHHPLTLSCTIGCCHCLSGLLYKKYYIWTIFSRHTKIILLKFTKMFVLEYPMSFTSWAICCCQNHQQLCLLLLFINPLCRSRCSGVMIGSSDSNSLSIIQCRMSVWLYRTSSDPCSPSMWRHWQVKKHCNNYSGYMGYIWLGEDVSLSTTTTYVSCS